MSVPITVTSGRLKCSKAQAAARIPQSNKLPSSQR